MTFVESFDVGSLAFVGGNSITGNAVLGIAGAFRIPSSSGDSFATQARTSTFIISAHRASQLMAL